MVHYLSLMTSLAKYVLVTSFKTFPDNESLAVSGCGTGAPRKPKRLDCWVSI